MSKKRLGAVLLVLVVAAGLLFFVGADKSVTADLRDLAKFKPIQAADENGVQTFAFGQSASVIHKFLDEHLNAKNGWVTDGYKPSEFYWYRPRNWESPVPQLLSKLHLGGPEVRIGRRSDSTEVTIYGRGQIQVPEIH